MIPAIASLAGIHILLGVEDDNLKQVNKKYR